MSEHSEPPRRFQISLRTFLVAVLAAGLTLGILGQLCRRQPEIFMALVAGLATIVPFALAIGTVLWVGYHRSPVWSLPVCASCRRDLRWLDLGAVFACPRCAADLTAPKGVAFVRAGYRSGGLIAWGIALSLVPLVGFGGLILFRMMAGPSNQALGLLSNQEVIQQRLLPQADQPPIWRELERRLAAGKLSQQEVDDVVNILIGHMKATKPTGWDQPFHWQGGFLKAASSAGMISDPVLIDLCDAFYGTKAVLQPMPRARENARNAPLRIEFGNSWGQQSGLGVMLLWEVLAVQLGDKPIKFRRAFQTDHDWMGHLDDTLPAGDHELTAEVECAYIDTEQLVGLNACELPAKNWPEARKRWRQTISVMCKVYTKDEPILRLVSDPSRAPDQTRSIRIDRLVLQNDHDGKKRIRLSIDFLENLAVPVGFDVVLKLTGQEIRLGSIHAARESGWNVNGGQQLEARLDSLDPSVLTADIILIPNPSHLEQYPQVTEIWGETIVVPQVSLERFDLEAGGGKNSK